MFLATEQWYDAWCCRAKPGSRKGWVKCFQCLTCDDWFTHASFHLMLKSQQKRSQLISTFCIQVCIWPPLTSNWGHKPRHTLGLLQVACFSPVHTALARGCRPGPLHQCCLCRTDAGSSVGPLALAEAGPALLLCQPSSVGAGVVPGSGRAFLGGGGGWACQEV